MGVLMLFSMVGFFLWFCGSGISNLLYPQSDDTPFLMILIVFTFLWLLTFFAQSWIGIRVLMFIKGARYPHEKERTRLKGLIASVQEEIFLKTGISPLTLDIFFEDNSLPTISSFGCHTLLLSRTLFEVATDKELKALITSELASLHEGASQRRLCLLILGLIPIFLAWSLKMIGKMLCEVSLSLAPKQKGAFPVIGVQIITFLMGFFLILGGILTKIALGILSFLVWLSFQRQTFASDFFVMQVGYGEGLLSFLHKIKNFDLDQTPSFFNRFTDISPKTAIRIGKLENALKSLC
ncbi:MAG: hypothetical protein JSS34_06020 [Proteobacteria bacterium]|nr:hypothetical protein [Pseudomonadota bacterium]